MATSPEQRAKAMTITLPAAAREPDQPTADGLPTGQRRWAIAAIFTALAMASLDTAIANIALPAIAANLRVTPDQSIWVVNGYQIALVATLLPLGALGEIVGHQRIYLGGLILFTVASLFCSVISRSGACRPKTVSVWAPAACSSGLRMLGSVSEWQ